MERRGHEGSSVLVQRRDPKYVAALAREKLLAEHLSKNIVRYLALTADTVATFVKLTLSCNEDGIERRLEQ